MYAELYACMRKRLVHVCGIWVHVCGNVWVQSIRLLGAKYTDTFGCMSMPSGCMSMPFGCMSMDRLGACMRLLGAKSAETFGCMYAVVGCKFHNG